MRNLNFNHIKEPYFEVWIKGKKLDDYFHKFIQEVSYEDHATGSDICSVTINDPQLRFISDPQFATAAPFKLIGGYRLNQREMMEGFISAVDYVFPDDGLPQIVVHAMDKTHVMDRIDKKRSWNKKSKYQVVSIIAKEYGFGFIGDNTGLAARVEDTISQAGETDIQFLMNLADDCGMLIYLKHNTIHLKKREYSKKPQGTLSYKISPFSLISFTPRLVQKEIPTEITTGDVNKKTGKEETGKADSNTPRESTNEDGTTFSDLSLEYDGDLKVKEGNSASSYKGTSDFR